MAGLSSRLRIAVIGHAEHVTVARVAALPQAGEILHLERPAVIAAGGGGIAFHQLVKSDAEVHFFTALGNDDAAEHVRAEITATGARVHAARRDQPHTRDLVLITPGGERTIVVVGEPLHPRHDDDLPWHTLEHFDAVYFTGQDPRTITAARAARVLVVTARRRHSLIESRVAADVAVGSSRDEREVTVLSDYPTRPGALVMTEGRYGGTIHTADGVTRFTSPPAPDVIAGTYGAGDTFAGALTWYLARGDTLLDACEHAGRHGAAVLRGINPLEWQMPLTQRHARKRTSA
jgi:ribokinase